MMASLMVLFILAVWPLLQVVGLGDLELATCGPADISGSFLLRGALVRQDVGELHAVVGRHGADPEQHRLGNDAQAANSDPTPGLAVHP
jgi:hypothetical protein